MVIDTIILHKGCWFAICKDQSDDGKYWMPKLEANQPLTCVKTVIVLCPKLPSFPLIISYVCNAKSFCLIDRKMSSETPVNKVNINNTDEDHWNNLFLSFFISFLIACKGEHIVIYFAQSVCPSLCPLNSPDVNGGF